MEDNTISEQELKVISNNETVVDDYAAMFNPTPIERNVVSEVKGQILDNIKESDDFLKAAEKLFNEKTKADFGKEALVIQDQQLSNDYEKYVLTKKKQLLDLRTKKEKKLIVEQVSAEIQEQKIINAKRRYGYLTQVVNDDGSLKLDNDGNPIIDMSKFTPNKASNKFKEMEHNYKNMSKTFQKVIATTAKTLLILGIVSIVIWIGVAYFIPLLLPYATI